MGNHEAAVQKKLKNRIEEEFPSVYLRKIHQTMYSHAGIPDLLGCLHGKFFAIEVKTVAGKLSRLQKRELSLIHRAEGLDLVCYGESEIEDIINELRVLRTNPL